MPAIAAWLMGLGLYKLAAFISAVAAATWVFYKFSFEICLMGAMISLFFTMFGFKGARTGLLFSIALYTVTQVIGLSIR